MAYKVQIIGTRAKFLADHVCQLGCKAEVIGIPDEISPTADICLASGVHYIIKDKYFSAPRLGIWGFHETALPRGRGCAPIQWTILNGIDILTVSFFELTRKLDAGLLLGQESAKITKSMLLEDIRELSLMLCKRLLDRHLIQFLDGKIQPYEQRGQPTYYRKRTPSDSKLDISKPLQDLWDLIRVCDNNEFPAWFEIEGQRIILKKYKAEQYPSKSVDNTKIF